MASSFGDIRKIDNSRTLMPLATIVLLVFLIWFGVWFFRGGSFRLYASIFFGLYYVTGQIWVSVLLIGVLQNIAFLPLRFIGMRISNSFKDFEDKIEGSSNRDALVVFSKKVQEGDFTILFYIFNFLVNAVAFLSAGRIFLIDFYTQKLNPAYLYHWVPYPDYPLVGTNFYLPFFKVTETTALSWKTIILAWIGISLFFAAIKLLWRISRRFLSGNKQLLSARINYNRFMLQTGGFSGTAAILSVILLRNLPIRFANWTLMADLTHQNTTMNTITAIGTFLTTMIAGNTSNRINMEIARKRGADKSNLDKVYSAKMRGTFKNALILGAGAFFITNQIPCAFELSVATFEVLYILSPLTFDKILIRAGANKNKRGEGSVEVTTTE